MTTVRKADAQKTKPTRYQVFLVKTDSHYGSYWLPVGEATTHGAKSAIQEVAQDPGDYRAVPVSNITAQPMAEPPPEPRKLVPVDHVADPAAQIEDALAEVDPPHSAAGGSLRAVPENDTESPETGDDVSQGVLS